MEVQKDAPHPLFSPPARAPIAAKGLAIAGFAGGAAVSAAGV